MTLTLPPDPALPLDPAEHAHARSRLLRAAVQVFDRKGYAAASVREIVEAAGVTKPVLYYHFQSKEGLLAAILGQALREFEAAIERAVERGGTARERLAGLCEDVYGLFEKNVPVVRVAHSVFHGPGGTVPGFDFTRFDSSLAAGLQRVVEDGQAVGEVRASAAGEGVALVVMGVIGACAARHLHGDLEPVGLEGLRRALDIVFDGVLRERRLEGEGTAS